MSDRLQHFSVYYLNFEKVFEIAMLLDNKVVTSQTEHDEKKHTSKLQARVKGMLTAIFSAEGEGSYEYANASGIKKTVELKTTNAVILRDLIEEIQSEPIKIDNLEEGQLTIIGGLRLSIENEEEMRQMKIIKQGVFDRFTHEDIPIGEIIKSLTADYSYILTANKENKKILIKIPSEAENEFENNYTIDDLLMGKITLIGIYKGVKRKEELTSTFRYLTSNEDEDADDEIVESDTGTNLSDKDTNQEYHFVDTLAIVQELKLGVANGK